MSEIIKGYGPLVTPTDVSDILGCGMNTTYKILASGEISAMRIGRSWKIPVIAVEEYILKKTGMKHSI